MYVERKWELFYDIFFNVINFIHLSLENLLNIVNFL
jgi:hypothetical protein